MSKKKLLRSGWFWFSIFWAALILFVSVIPAVDLPSINIWEPDKVAHFIVYAILTFSIGSTLIKNSEKPNKTSMILFSAITSISYSFSIELLQSTPLVSRTFDLLDLLANCIGTGLGCILLYRYRKVMEKGRF